MRPTETVLTKVPSISGEQYTILNSGRSDMLKLVILAASVAVVFGGCSPNADYIDQLMSMPGARYSNNILEDAKHDVEGLIAKYGYPVESHEVITQDNYVLTMHRIPHGRDRNNQPSADKPIVFLMHGLLTSSADFLLLGPGTALAYMLAEEGYDVWMGNARGNFYSRRHLLLNPDSKFNQDFWKFSWDEIGNLDLPAFLDRIEKITGKSELHYVGHSQGGTSFLVLASLRPEYNKKFISFQGLAPASYFNNNVQPHINRIAPLESILESALFAMGRAEVFGNREFFTWFSTNYCYGDSLFQPICESAMAGGMSDYFNQTMIPVLLGHTPAGASIRQLAHYGQSVRFGAFRRFNHNFLTNLALYGSRNPPAYDMSLITTPSYIHYSTSDVFVHPDDVRLLASRLGNVVELNLVNSPVFDHVDFIWGSSAKRLVYDRMLESMRHAEENWGLKH